MFAKKEREKVTIKQKIGINLTKYITEDALAIISGNLDKSLSFLSYLLMPTIILNFIFLAISLYIKIKYNSEIFYILFYIVSLIISVLSGGVFGLRSAIKNTADGIKGITRYSVNLLRDIYPLLKKDKVLEIIPPSKILNAISFFVVLPIVQKVLRRKIFGNLYYFFIDIITTKSLGILGSTIDALFKNKKENGLVNNCNEGTEVENFPVATNKILEKISGIFDNVIKGILFLLDMIFVILFVAGSLALVILIALWRFKG